MALKQETEQIKQELEMPGQVGLTRDISVIFDGSTRQGEAIAIIMNVVPRSTMNTNGGTEN